MKKYGQIKQTSVGSQVFKDLFFDLVQSSLSFSRVEHSILFYETLEIMVRKDVECGIFDKIKFNEKTFNLINIKEIEKDSFKTITIERQIYE